MNWRDLSWDVARFFGWGPDEQWSLTAPELLEACKQTHRIAARQAAAAAEKR